MRAYPVCPFAFSLEAFAAMAPRDDVTMLLASWRAGDERAMQRLTPLLYDELRRIAHGKLRYERGDHTLNTTALVHEAYLGLVDQTQATWQSRAHFLAAAAQTMRHVLLHYAEKRRALKRGGGLQPLALDEVPEAFTDARADEMIALDEALNRLASFDPEGAQIVEYRYFAGLTQDEVAEVLGISERTVRRHWVRAKTWIKRDLQHDA